MRSRTLVVCSIIIAFAAAVSAQSEEELAFIEQAESGGSWWPYILMMAIGAGVAVYFWLKSKKGKDKPQYNYQNRYANYYENSSYNMEDLDAAKELEWLRKAKKSGAKPAAAKAKPKMPAATTTANVTTDELNFDTKVFQEKMRKLQYAQLPINSFTQLSEPRSYEPLPLSNDESLLSAVEQANEEFEEDESVRELAVRVLAAFCTRNSVESLSQIALYDLSSNLRSKAVAVLTDFDHEAVFEPILLACADPTREVRAAAARGLFRLNFDRADAWARIIETNDDYRMSHAARAAIESGIVVKSFDRLVHDDLKIAYEAFALVMLLIRSGETNEIFEAIRNHKDERVRFALIHVLTVAKDERTFDALDKLRREDLPTDVAERVVSAIESFSEVAA